MNATRPTLLVFTLGPHREARRRPLLPASLQGFATGIHAAGLAAALAAGRECGCRLVVSTPQPLPLAEDVTFSPQRGAGFGERLADAVRAGATGGGPLVVVGTDVPELGASHLQKALDGLAEDPGRVVLGPSPDGGLYLLAAARPIAELLAQVAWCRPDTLHRLCDLLARAGFRVELLEPLADLDGPGDLERWLAARFPASSPALLPAWRSLARRLRQLLAAWKLPASPRLLGRPCLSTVTVRAARAPPPGR